MVLYGVMNHSFFSSFFTCSCVFVIGILGVAYFGTTFVVAESSLPLDVVSSGEDTSGADFQLASTDATLSDLSLVGIPLSTSFDPDNLTYVAETTLASTEVRAQATHTGATVRYELEDADEETDGHQVDLAEGETSISILVTAEDGTTSTTYTIVVTRQRAAEESQTVPLLDEEGATTQAYTGVLTLGLASGSDTGLQNNDRVIKNRNGFTFTFSSSTSDYPHAATNTTNYFVAVKAFPSDPGGSATYSSRSCADSTIPTGSVNVTGTTVGSTFWQSVVGNHIPNGQTSLNLNFPTGINLNEGPHCFIGVYTPGLLHPNSLYSSHSATLEIIVDFTRPTVTVVEPTDGKVYAYANETAEVKTKDNVASADCTNTTSTASGWSDYTPDGTTVSFSGDGRCFIFTDVAGNTKAAHTGAKVGGIAIVDYDTDDNNLIDIDGTNAEGLAKLDAIRYDLDGNGIPDSSTNVAAYRTAFPGTLPTGTIFGCPGVCAGYELRRSLDFDTDGDGRTWTGTVVVPTGDSDDTYDNSGKGWIPIGGAYTRVLDGNGYTIDNLFVKRGSGDTGAAGLFHTIGTGGIVRNLGLRDVAVRTHGDAGGIASINRGTIQTSFVTGDNHGYNAGLMAASNFGTIAHSYTKGTVDAGGGNAVAGGIAGNRGAGSSAGTIKNSWTATNARANRTRQDVPGTSSGIASAGTITNSYFDTDVHGITGTNGKTTEELQMPTGYTGIYATWDDDDIDGITGADAPWDFTTNAQYPYLTFGGHRLERQAPFVASLIPTPDNAQVTLTWTADNTDDATGWQFAYKTQGAADWESWADVPSSTAGTRSHTITSLTNDTTYLFKVRAVGGPESAETATTPAADISAIDFDANDNNLIEITTLEQLHAMRHDLDGDGVPDSGSSIAAILSYYSVFKTSRVGFFCDSCDGYELMNDLDFNTGEATRSDDTYYNSGAGWEPIGDDINRFATTFDGNGFVLKNLSITRATTDAVGFFGVTDVSAVLTEVALRDVEVSGQRYTGSLVGYSDGVVRASYATGTVTGTDSVGGLVGVNRGTLSSSYSTIDVSGTSSVGGLIGANFSSGRVKDAYSTGAVSGTGDNVGGLIGLVSGAASSVTTSYWDTRTSRQASRTGEKGGIGKTTLELQNPVGYTTTGIYSTWDDGDIDGDGEIDSPWDFGSTSEYPVLTFGGHLSQTQRSGDLAVHAFSATPGDTRVTLAWDSRSILGITGWEFDYKVHDAGSWTGWADVPSSTARTSTHTVESLTNGTTYLFKVRAKGTGVTRGTESREALVTPGAGISIIDFDSNDNNRIEITTLEQLNAMRYDLDGDGIPSGTVVNMVAYYDAFKTSRAGLFCTACAGYELMNDLDFNTGGTTRDDDTYHNSGSGWNPIGDDINRFATTFAGNGFVIKNLLIRRSSTSYVGLFGVTDTSAVLAGIALRAADVTGGASTGSLVGYNNGTLRSSYVVGSVTGASAVGGLVGIHDGTLTAAYSKATVTGTISVGGLVGEALGSATIKNVYSTGGVTGTPGSSSVGGLIGLKAASSTITTSYWDTQTSGHATSPGGGSGRTTVQLTSQTGYALIYSTWDDDDIDGDGMTDSPWDFGTTSEYPLLSFDGHDSAAQRPNVVSAIIASPGNASVTLSWLSNRAAGFGWQFSYKTKDDASWVEWADVPSSTSDTRSHTVQPLVNGTTYLFKVRSKGVGTTRGAESAEVVATPGASVPETDFDSNDNNLIEITTLEQLNAMRYDLDGDGIPSGSLDDTIAYYAAFQTSRAGFFCDACAGYELMNDLDFNDNDPGDRSDDTYYNDGSGWDPIGDNLNPFATTFNGNEFVIRNLLINWPTTDYIGLFGGTSSSAVLAWVVLSGASVTGRDNTGSLVGHNAGSVRTSHAAGSIIGGDHVGGLVGSNDGGSILASYSTAAVSGASAVGGLAGEIAGSAVIKNSYSTGVVAITALTGVDIGGLVGHARHTTATVVNSYWDTATSGQTSSGGGTGKTTTELQAPTDYTGIYATWDDDDIDGDGEIDSPWVFGSASEYPILSFSSFNLDLDGSSGFVARQDLLGTYLFLAEGISDSQLRTYTHNQEQSVANEMAALIRESITGAAPPLDFDGNGTVSARLDVLGAYLYTAEGISASQLRAYTHNQEQGTANDMADLINSLIE